MKGESSPIPRGNKNYKEDIKYTTELSDYLLLTLGVWPFSRSESNFVRYLKFLVAFLCYALLVAFTLPAILHWVLIEKNPTVKLSKLPLIFYNIMSLTKYSGLLFQENEIARCFRHVEEDWRNIDNEIYRSIMRNKAKLGRRLLLICGALMCSCIWFYRVFLPLSRGTIVTPLNVTIRPLPCTSYYVFFDPQVSPNYEIVFCIQIISGLVTFSVNTTICGLATVFVVHACGQLEILVVLMNRLVEKIGIEENETRERLSVMVEHQVRVRNFLQQVERTMQQICLFEIMGCTLTMCFSGYCLITDWGTPNKLSMTTYFVGLSTVTAHIFMFCFVGEQLTSLSEEVATTSSVLEWYRLSDKKAKSVILIMSISRCPIKITAGNVVELSFQTFGQVIKTAVAYCNILRTVTV